MTCPIARTLDIVGEWWTLLIIRDALVGARRFDDFRQTGIADNILSTRLDLLVREGILERRAYQEHPLRYEYLLTEKGQDLLPVVVALGKWGLKWTGVPGNPPRFRHSRCGTEVELSFRCPTCGNIVQPGEIRVERAQPLPVPPAMATDDGAGRPSEADDRSIGTPDGQEGTASVTRSPASRNPR